MHLCINVILIFPGSYIHADKWQRESPLKQLSEFDKSFEDIRYTPNQAYITPWVYNTCMSISTSILFPLGMSTGRYVVCPNSHLFSIAGTWCTTQWVLALYTIQNVHKVMYDTPYSEYWTHVVHSTTGEHILNISAYMNLRKF